MEIKPLNDRVLLKWIAKENVTHSWIYIPETSNKDKPFIYEVVAVWPGKGGVNISVKPGDKILCGQYAWDDIILDDQEYKIIAMDYILAIVD